MMAWLRNKDRFFYNPLFWLLTAGIVAAVVLTGGFLFPLLAAIPALAYSAEKKWLNFSTWTLWFQGKKEVIKYNAVVKSDEERAQSSIDSNANTAVSQASLDDSDSSHSTHLSDASTADTLSGSSSPDSEYLSPEEATLLAHPIEDVDTRLTPEDKAVLLVKEMLPSHSKKSPEDYHRHLFVNGLIWLWHLSVPFWNATTPEIKEKIAGEKQDMNDFFATALNSMEKPTDASNQNQQISLLKGSLLLDYQRQVYAGNPMLTQAVFQENVQKKPFSNALISLFHPDKIQQSSKAIPTKGIVVFNQTVLPEKITQLYDLVFRAINHVRSIKDWALNWEPLDPKTAFTENEDITEEDLAKHDAWMKEKDETIARREKAIEKLEAEGRETERKTAEAVRKTAESIRSIAEIRYGILKNLRKDIAMAVEKNDFLSLKKNVQKGCFFDHEIVSLITHEHASLRLSPQEVAALIAAEILPKDKNPLRRSQSFFTGTDVVAASKEPNAPVRRHSGNTLFVFNAKTSPNSQSTHAPHALPQEDTAETTVVKKKDWDSALLVRGQSI